MSAASVTPADAPLADFTRCHLGIVSQLQTLSELPELLEAARRASTVAAQTVQLFEDNVLPHHADEEQELFPAVQRSARAGEEAAQVAAMAQRLTLEHRGIEAQWQKLAPELRQAARGKPVALDVPGLERLIRDYLSHARFEESQYLPLAARILTRDRNHLAALDLSLHIRHAVVPVQPYI